jgi:hypothetical protein
MQRIADSDNLAPRIEKINSRTVGVSRIRHSNAEVEEIMRTLVSATWIQKKID